MFFTDIVNFLFYNVDDMIRYVPTHTHIHFTLSSSLRALDMFSKRNEENKISFNLQSCCLYISSMSEMHDAPRIFVLSISTDIKGRGRYQNDYKLLFIKMLFTFIYT